MLKARGAAGPALLVVLINAERAKSGASAALASTKLRKRGCREVMQGCAGALLQRSRTSVVSLISCDIQLLVSCCKFKALTRRCSVAGCVPETKVLV